MVVRRARLLAFALLVVGCLGVGTLVASAQTAPGSFYTGTPTPNVGSVQVGGSAALHAVTQARTTSLPFTGTDVVELVAFGVALIGLGALLRHSTREKLRFK
jgi:hypothetical protein